jgi:hypothetical protein
MNRRQWFGSLLGLVAGAWAARRGCRPAGIPHRAAAGPTSDLLLRRRDVRV